MVVSSWEQVVESSERNNEEPWSFIQGISFPHKPRTPPHSRTTTQRPVCGGRRSKHRGCWRPWASELPCSPRFDAALLEQAESTCGCHCSAAAATDRSPGQQAPVWKETVHLGFPGVKWSPAAGATRRLHIWWWLTMLVFLWKPHSDWGACVWSCLP